jgi:hypothetical protein
MRVTTQGLLVAITLATTTIAGAEVAAQTTSEQQALLQFQRAADTYAFQHRQVERRLGGTPDAGAMATGMRTQRRAEEGVLFTPLVAAAFRSRIQLAVGKGRCAGPATDSLSSFVPRPNDPAAGTKGLSECLVAALPKLPPELEYRSASVALLLIDVHAGVVVDVVHGAFPVRNN